MKTQNWYYQAQFQVNTDETPAWMDTQDTVTRIEKYRSCSVDYIEEHLQPAYVVNYSKASSSVKNEDVSLTHEPNRLAFGELPSKIGDCWSMYCLCDGHNGSGAGNFVKQHLWTELLVRLPSYLPHSWASQDGQRMAAQVRSAIISALAALDQIWSQMNFLSGCAVTVIIIGGRLVTCANVGDTQAHIDVGTKTMELTESHRLQTNKGERERLQQSCVLVAPLSESRSGPAGYREKGIGILRAWPGGLAISRSLGDLDTHPEVVCVPHVKQILVPPTGARITTATGCLWDTLPIRQALQISRSHSRTSAPLELLSFVKKGGLHLVDDVIIFVIDILPHYSDDFAKVAKGMKPIKKIKGFTWCGKPKVTYDEEDVQFYSDVDALDEMQQIPASYAGLHIHHSRNRSLPAFGFPSHRYVFPQHNNRFISGGVPFKQKHGRSKFERSLRETGLYTKYCDG
ncbi:hypothetical protein BSKO_01664 [Bryopsis sp. KO-2023]|nr:hypothetical protein BSKO_01664 [Bryopsis sp. KO-2023]